MAQLTRAGAEAFALAASKVFVSGALIDAFGNEVSDRFDVRPDGDRLTNGGEVRNIHGSPVAIRLFTADGAREDVARGAWRSE